MSMVLVLAMTAPLMGCIVHTGPRYRSRGQQARSCPPAHHLEAGACVHNGRARGHHKR